MPQHIVTEKVQKKCLRIHNPIVLNFQVTDTSPELHLSWGYHHGMNLAPLVGSSSWGCGCNQRFLVAILHHQP